MSQFLKNVYFGILITSLLMLSQEEAHAENSPKHNLCYSMSFQNKSGKLYAKYGEYVSRVVGPISNLVWDAVKIEEGKDSFRSFYIKKCTNEMNLLKDVQVIVDYDDYSRIPVLSNLDICSETPTLYLLEKDSIHKKGGDGDFFSRKFYLSKSNTPKDKTDLGESYQKLLNGEVSSAGYRLGNYRHIWPHQFFVRSQFVGRLTESANLQASDDLYPDSTEHAIVRSLPVIYKQCNKLPKAINLVGIMVVVDKYEPRNILFFKRFFEGQYIPNKEYFEIVAKPEYRALSSIFEGIYEKYVENEKAFYEGLANRKAGSRSSPTATAIAGAAVLGLLGVIIMDNAEKCRTDPNLDC